jgi:hypothetical protein
MELPVANVSTPTTSPQTLKNTLAAFYHSLEREHCPSPHAGKAQWLEYL